MYSEANFYYQRAYTLASTLVKDHVAEQLRGPKPTTVPSFVRWLGMTAPSLKNNPPRSRSQTSTPGRDALDEPIQIVTQRDGVSDDKESIADPRIDIMTILFNEALLLFDVGGAEKLEHAHELLVYALQWFEESEFPTFTKTDEAVGLLMSIYLMSGLIQLSLYLEVGGAAACTTSEFGDGGRGVQAALDVDADGDGSEKVVCSEDEKMLRTAFASYKEAICLGNVYLHYDHDLLHNAICSQRRARRLIGDFLDVHCAAAA
jgi:hypothetical protein